ncbi:expressed unknown protein [Seminavis robusta]|uniref:Uncharacterized protein n=1 Tax=Seminavis robusta TaxID=568900 RepID=A0A9N8DX83_9STRA|nr:expressed unknown protein [Seminavis robusta]|eukprot:Sro444_g144370.1 n/a (136) ;mRNA; r:50247-50654
MNLFGKHFCLFVLALLASSLHTSDAFAGFAGDDKKGKGDKGGGQQAAGGGGGGGGGGKQNEEGGGLLSDLLSGLQLGNFICGSDEAFSAVQLLCNFMSTYIEGQLSTISGTEATTQETQSAAGIVVTPATRKLRH